MRTICIFFFTSVSPEFSCHALTIPIVLHEYNLVSLRSVLYSQRNRRPWLPPGSENYVCHCTWYFTATGCVVYPCRILMDRRYSFGFILSVISGFSFLQVGFDNSSEIGGNANCRHELPDKVAIGWIKCIFYVRGYQHAMLAVFILHESYSRVN